MSKNTGIVRKIDELGRIVVPKEIRNIYDINEGDVVEFFVDEEKIIIRKYKTQTCIFCKSTERLTYFREQFVCFSCVENVTKPLQQRRGRATDTLERLIEAMERHPGASQKQLAQLIGVSQGRVSQLMKQMA